MRKKGGAVPTFVLVCATCLSVAVNCQDVPADSSSGAAVQVGTPVAMKFTALDGREVDTEKMLGKVILVHFWATWSGTYDECILPAQKAYQEYHDKGLEVIGINLDTDRETVEKLIADKSIPWPQYFDGKEWENRFVRLYGIKTIPTMWLIDRDGKLADMDVDWSNPARKMEEQKALDEFNKTYVLSEGEDLKYVPAPYLPGRLVYQREKEGDAGRPVPENWFFVWNGGLRGERRAYGQGTGWPLRDILRLLAGIHPREIEGDDELLNRRLLGDFIVREGLTPEKIVSLFEPILRRELKLPVKMTFREVPREVIVARGKYEFRPISGSPRDTIEIYGERLTTLPQEGGRYADSADIGEFLSWVGEYLDRRMVSEVESPPEASLKWHENFREEGRKAPELVLQHLTEQTGLRFAKETRRVRVLFVERAD